VPLRLATSTPQTFPVATRPGYYHQARAFSRRLPNRRLAAIPAHIHQVRAGSTLRGFAAGSSRTPLHLACRTRAVWQYRPVPSLSGLLPPSPAPPGSGCPQLHRPAATGSAVESSHLHSVNQRHVAHADEVEQVSKPAIGIVGCPSVQLGLDPQYPRLRLLDGGRRPRRVGVHRRPPGLPAPTLRACCPPWPCGRLSHPRTTTGTPPRPATLSRRRACPPPAWLAGGKGGRRAVPTFTTRPVDGIGAQLFPGSLATPTPQPFNVASQPGRATACWRVAHPPARRACAADRPMSTRFGAGVVAFGGSTTGSCTRTPLRLASRARAVWRCRPVSSLSGLLPALPGASQVRLPPASPACCDRPAAEPFHLHPVSWRLVAHALDNPVAAAEP
jgi:hypothetical protein